jgi:hypothetical protein
MKEGTLRQSVKLPPVAWAPHSMMCPATMPLARRSQSSPAQPKAWIMAARVMPVSVTRPQRTISGSCLNASTTGSAPK